MAAVPTKQIPLGFKAPDFKLQDVVSGRNTTLHELKSPKGTVVFFICNHCPYVLHILDKLVETARQYKKRGISFIAISSNDADAYPEDSPVKMREYALKYNFPFPYLYDDTQEVARAYQAECTPDFNVFDGNLACIYRGQFDDSRPGNNIPVTGNDLSAVLENMLNGKEITKNQKPSVGCSIKWKV